MASSADEGGFEPSTFATVCEVLSEFSGVPVEKITLDSSLGQEDRTAFSGQSGGPLGLDSLDLINVAMGLEEKFGIELPDEDVDRQELGTVRGLIAHIEAKMAGKREGEERPAQPAALDRPAHGGFPDATPRPLGDTWHLPAPAGLRGPHVGRIRTIVAGRWDGTYRDACVGDVIQVTADMTITSDPNHIERAREAPPEG